MFQICNQRMFMLFLVCTTERSNQLKDYNTVRTTIKIMQFMTVIIGSTTCINSIAEIIII